MWHPVSHRVRLAGNEPGTFSRAARNARTSVRLPATHQAFAAAGTASVPDPPADVRLLAVDPRLPQGGHHDLDERLGEFDERVLVADLDRADLVPRDAGLGGDRV